MYVGRVVQAARLADFGLLFDLGAVAAGQRDHERAIRRKDRKNAKIAKGRPEKAGHESDEWTRMRITGTHSRLAPLIRVHSCSFVLPPLFCFLAIFAISAVFALSRWERDCSG
jgi:hypothetical protein